MISEVKLYELDIESNTQKIFFISLGYTLHRYTLHTEHVSSLDNAEKRTQIFLKGFLFQ